MVKYIHKSTIGCFLRISDRWHNCTALADRQWTGMVAKWQTRTVAHRVDKIRTGSNPVYPLIFGWHIIDELQIIDSVLFVWIVAILLGTDNPSQSRVCRLEMWVAWFRWQGSIPCVAMLRSRSTLDRSTAVTALSKTK